MSHAIFNVFWALGYALLLTLMSIVFSTLVSTKDNRKGVIATVIWLGMVIGFSVKYWYSLP